MNDYPPIFSTTKFSQDAFNTKNFLTKSQADLLYLPLTFISGITFGIASPLKPLITNNSNSITGINNLGCTSLTLNGTLLTSTASELNYLSGITAGTASASKALVVDSSRNIINLNNVGLTTISIGSFIIDSTELSYIDSVTPGTASASKALVVDSSRNITNINNLSITGKFLTSLAGRGFEHNDGAISLISFVNNTTNPNNAYIGTSTNHNLYLQTNNIGRLFIQNDGKIGVNNSAPAYQLDITGSINTTSLNLNSVAVTATAAQLNYLSGVTAGTTTASKALVVDSSKNITGISQITTTTSLLTFYTPYTSICGTSTFVFYHIYNGNIQIGTQSNNSFDFITNNNTQMTLNSSGSLNIINHNGSSIGLQLAGTLVTATAAKLNYNDITTLGTFQSSKTMTLDSSGVGLLGLGNCTSNCLRFYGNTANKEIVCMFRDSDDAGLIIATKASTIQKCSPILQLYSGYDITSGGTSSAEYKEVIRSNHKLVGITDNYQSGWFHGYLLGLASTPWKSSGFGYGTQFYTSMEALNIACNSSSTSSFASSNNFLIYNNKFAFGTTTFYSNSNFTVNASPSFIGSSGWVDGSYQVCGSFRTSDSLNEMQIQILSGGDCFVGTKTNNNFALMTNNSRVMTLMTSGRVGIGTNAPLASLEVTTSVSQNIDILSQGVAYFLKSGGLISTIGPFTGIGVGIKTTAAILAGAGVYTTSDKRIKKDIVAMSDDIDILKVRPVLFRYKNQDENVPLQPGYIAQDLIKAGLIHCINFTENVNLDIEDETVDMQNIQFSVDYSKICLYLHIALQKQNKRIEDLEQKSKYLEEFIKNEFLNQF